MAITRVSTNSGLELLNELVKEGKLEKEYGQAVVARYTTAAQVATFLLGQNKLKEEDIIKAVSIVYGLPFVHLQGKSIDRNILLTIPESLARRYGIVAYQQVGTTLKVAVGRPYQLDPGTGSSKSGPLSQIEKEKGISIELVATTMADIVWALKAYQIKSENPTPSATQSASLSTSLLPNIDLVAQIIPKQVLLKFPKEIAAKYQIVPFEMPAQNRLKVAIVDSHDVKTKEIINFIQRRNGIAIDLFQTNEKDFKIVLARYDHLDPNLTSSQPAVKPLPVTPSAVSANKINPDLDLDTIPSGKSPEIGGMTKDGILLIGSKEIALVQTGSLAEGIITGESLEERNLDSFLGKPVISTAELAGIIKTGFIPKSVAAILSYGIFLRASDIHLEPMKSVFRLRYRVDGDLAEYLFLPLALHPPITSRIKILSNLKIDEQRIPQDGRYDAIANKHEFDVRVSSLPTVHGEKIVMRLLDKSSSAYTLEKLGMGGSNFTRLVEQLKKPWGIIMSTGPTGSGKSTTLYAVLNRIASPKVNVITLEDPVEYEMKGINQVQVKPKIGFSFAEGLRSVLRQDPNIIMVGEIRDSETAELATHAALTGHLVLTTLHTNNAAGALPRLINMGVEPFLITSAVNAVVAQRLVRKLCQKCKKPINVPTPIIEQIKSIMAGDRDIPSNQKPTYYGPVGCQICKTGYFGRIGVYEVLVMSDKIEEAAIKNAPASEIETIAKSEGMVTLQQDGILKAMQGLTSLDEVFKVTTNE